jgi:hypothetical protein
MTVGADEAEIGVIVIEEGAAIVTWPFPTIKDEVNPDITPSVAFIV